MDQTPPKTDRIATLRRYAAGELGTREAIERAGFDDFADLLIAMAQADLAMPRPSDTPARAANIARATDMLQPLLRRGH